MEADTTTSPLAPVQPEPMSQTEQRAQRLTHLEGFFEGLDKVDARIPAEQRTDFVAALDASEDPQDARAQAVNKAWVGYTQPQTKDLIETQWPYVKAQLAKSFGVTKPDVSDSELYGMIGTHVKKANDERTFAHELATHVQLSALEGDTNWLASYRQFTEGAQGQAGFDPAHTDDYRRIAEAAHSQVAETAHRIGPVVHQVSELFGALKSNDASALDTETQDQQGQALEATIDALQTLPPSERAQAIQLAASKISRETGEQDRGFVGKVGETLNRSFGSMGRALINQVQGFLDRNVGPLDDPTHGPDSSDVVTKAEDRRQIRRELTQAFNQAADPIRGNMATSAIYGLTDLIPKLGLIASPQIGVPLLIAEATDKHQGELVAQGVPVDKARSIAAVQGTIDTASMFLTSNIVFGKLPAILEQTVAKSGLGLAGRLLAVGALDAGTLRAGAALQQFGPLAVQDWASKFMADVPGVKPEEITNILSHEKETWISLLPLMVIGGGIGSFKEVSKWADYTADMTNLKAVGFTDAQATKLADIPKLDERIAEIQKTFPERDTGTTTQTDALNALDEQHAQPEQQQQQGAVITPTESGYVVTETTGKLIDTVKSAEEAQRLADTFNKTQNLVTGPDPLPPVVDKPPFEPSAQALGITGGNAGQLVLDAWNRLSSDRRKFLNLVKARDAKNAFATEFGAQQNKADIYARQTANTLADDVSRSMDRKAKDGSLVRRPLDESALTFMVEAQNDLTKLTEMQTRLAAASGTGLNFKWIGRASAAIEHAIKNFKRLEPVADRYTKTLDSHLAQEQAMGIAVERRAGYVPHLQDVDSGVDLPFANSSGGSGGSTSFKKARAFDTYVDSILAGYTPKTINAITLMENRLGRGQRVINRQLWATAGRSIYDPSTALPLVSDMVASTRQLNGKTVPQMDAPRGYEPKQLGNQTIAVLKGYTGLYDALQTPSAFQNSTAGKAVLQANSLAKHTTLFFDTFHLGRLAFHQLALRASASYRGGLLLLDHTLPEIQTMIANGELGKGIDPAFTAQFIQHKANLDLLLDKGLNVASVGDNMHAHLIQQIPGIGAYNKFLFDKFQRGGVVQTALIELERHRAMYKGVADDVLAARVAKDLNTRFGNLGTQSWIKSRTFQDLARVLFLAPGWNEGLIRSELGAYKQIVQAGGEAIFNQRLAMGTLSRNVGALVLGQFLGNQVLNYATRGHPTWENPEEGFSAKTSAWVPDVFGDHAPGLFLNPFALSAEISEQLAKRFETNGQAMQSLLDVGSYKLSGIGRAASTFLRRDDGMGKHLFSDEDVGKAMIKALIPLPIQTGTIIKAVKSGQSGEVTQHYPGEIEKQAFATFGIKAQNAPSALQRVSTLAREYKKENGLEKDFIAGESDYSALKKAIANGNSDDTREAMDELLTKRTPAEITKYLAQSQHRPFTGSHKDEAKFRASLNAEEKEAYAKANETRQETTKKALLLLQSAKKPNTK
jgi:hypothetical protein